MESPPVVVRIPAKGTWPADNPTYGSWRRTGVAECKDLRCPGFLSSQKCTVLFSRFWDQSTRPNDHASCKLRHLPIKFIPLALSMHFHEAPASTAVRNASTNLPHVHRPEARYSHTLNVTGGWGGPVIQTPSGLRMLHRLDDRQTSTTDETGILRPTDKFFDFSPVSTTRGHAYKLYKPRCTNALRKNFFTERVVNVWNSLPHNVDFSSLPKFKNSITQVDFSHFLRCTV